MKRAGEAFAAQETGRAVGKLVIASENPTRRVERLPPLLGAFTASEVVNGARILLPDHRPADPVTVWRSKMQRLSPKVSHPVVADVRITPAVRDLVARSAALPRGLAFLNRGPTECVASALGAPVHLVEHARTCLEDGPDRVQLLEEHAAAVQRSRQAWPTSPVHFSPPPRGPEEVVGEAERHPLGVEFLLRAPFETVAVTFGAHPDVVLAARDLLGARAIQAGTASAGR